MYLGAVEKFSKFLTNYRRVVGVPADFGPGYAAVFRHPALGEILYRIVGRRDNEVTIKVADVEREEQKELVGRTLPVQLSEFSKPEWEIYEPKVKLATFNVTVLSDKQPVGDAKVEFFGGVPPFFFGSLAEGTTDAGGKVSLRVPTWPILGARVSKPWYKTRDVTVKPTEQDFTVSLQATFTVKWWMIAIPLGAAVAGVGIWTLARRKPASSRVAGIGIRRHRRRR